MYTPCYCAAVRTAARKTTALYDFLEPAGVTLAQYSLLRKIERAGTVSLTKLGRLAELDRSTVGRNVKALEELRLVRRPGRRTSARRRCGSRPPARGAANAPLPCGRKRSGGSRPRWAPARPGSCGRLRLASDFFAKMRVVTRQLELKMTASEPAGRISNAAPPQRRSAAFSLSNPLAARDGRAEPLLWLDRRGSDLPRHAGDGGSDGRAGRHHRSRSRRNSAGAPPTSPRRLPCASLLFGLMAPFAAAFINRFGVRPVVTRRWR